LGESVSNQERAEGPANLHVRQSEFVANESSGNGQIDPLDIANEAEAGQ
jgi:hypothetical protein